MAHANRTCSSTVFEALPAAFGRTCTYFACYSLNHFNFQTNHLDLDACVWLETELSEYKRALIIVSHSQDFMNAVCTNMIHLFQKKLDYYGGNYDTFVRTRAELLEAQAKKYNWEQNQLAHMKEYIARFGHGSAKLARQAQSKEKTMAKMVAGGLTDKVVMEGVKQFYFFNPGDVSSLIFGHLKFTTFRSPRQSS